MTPLDDFLVQFAPVGEDVVVPTRATQDSVGYDLRAYVHGREIEWVGQNGLEARICNDLLFLLHPGDTARIPLGFASQFDPPLEAQIRLRSSLGFRGLIIPNAPGTIDPDYRGEWKIVLANISRTPYEINHADRIAQVVFSRVLRVSWERSSLTQSRRTGGFGSTGPR